MKNILGLQIHHSLSYCLKFFMQINRIWTKLCQLKLGGSGNYASQSLCICVCRIITVEWITLFVWLTLDWCAGLLSVTLQAQNYAAKNNITKYHSTFKSLLTTFYKTTMTGESAMPCSCFYVQLDSSHVRVWKRHIIFLSTDVQSREIRTAYGMSKII